MVVAAFPVAKLGALLIKQVSKPIANAVKNQAKSSPVFRKYVCLPPAQFYNWCEVKAKMWLLHLGQPVNIPVLSEASAIDLGANLVGEGVIFIIAAVLLIAEYNRSSRKETAKEEAKKQEMLELQSTLKELFIQTEEQGARIRELVRKVGHLETSIVEKSSKNGRRQQSTTDDPPQPPSSTPPPSSSATAEECLPIIIIEDVDLKEVEKQPEYASPEINLLLLDNYDNDRGQKKMRDSSYVRKVESRGIIWRAIYDLETNLWGRESVDCSYREPGIVNVALNYLYDDVYRMPLRFY